MRVRQSRLPRVDAPKHSRAQIRRLAHVQKSSRSRQRFDAHRRQKRPLTRAPVPLRQRLRFHRRRRARRDRTSHEPRTVLAFGLARRRAMDTEHRRIQSVPLGRRRRPARRARELAD